MTKTLAYAATDAASPLVGGECGVGISFSFCTPIEPTGIQELKLIPTPNHVRC